MNSELGPFEGTFDTLEHLADTISHVLACPVTLEDAQHRLLAYSSHRQEVTDEARLATIIGRRVPEDVINRLWESGVIQQLNEQIDPVEVPPIHSVGLGHRVAISIRRAEDVLGYIWAISQNPFTDLQRLYLRQAARAASAKLLQLRARRRQEQERQQEFLWGLLTESGWTHEKVLDAAAERNIHLPPEFAIVVFQSDVLLDDRAFEQLTYVVHTNQQQRIVTHIRDDARSVLLLGPHASQPWKRTDAVQFVHTTQEQMAERFGHDGIRGAMGRIYQNFAKVRTCYREARDVLRLQSLLPAETMGVVDFESLGMYQFFPTLMEYKLRDGCPNSKLVALRSYDAKHHVHLVETLESYLEHDGNLKVTSEALHIHVNTLLYRLRRIGEIGALDMNDAAAKMTLFMEMKLEKAMHRGSNG